MFFLVNARNEIRSVDKTLKGTLLNSRDMFYVLDSDDLLVEECTYDKLLETVRYSGISIVGLSYSSSLGRLFFNQNHVPSIEMYWGSILAESVNTYLWDTINIFDYTYSIYISADFLYINGEAIYGQDVFRRYSLQYYSGFRYIYRMNDMFIGRYLLMDSGFLIKGLVTFLFDITGKLLGVLFPDSIKIFDDKSVVSKFAMLDSSLKY